MRLTIGWIQLAAALGALQGFLLASVLLARRSQRERPYRDPDLTLPDLATRLDTSPHKLSEVLNSEIRPYVGLGADAVLARETSDVVDLRTEKAVVPHLLTGFEVSLGRASLGAEFTWGALPSISVQVGAVMF